MDYVEHGEQAVGHCIAEAQVAAFLPAEPEVLATVERRLHPPKSITHAQALPFASDDKGRTFHMACSVRGERSKL